MSTNEYLWLLKNIIPYIRLTLYYAKINGRQYKSGYRALKPGHIILTIDKKKLTTFLVPGEWTHAALCVGKGDDSEYEVAEMTHKDYTKSMFFDICKESDRVMVLECVDFTETYINNMISQCKTYERARYDVAFDFGVEALYCSELIYQSDFSRILDVDLSDLAGLGRQYISPDGLRKANNVRVVWDSDLAFSQNSVIKNPQYIGGPDEN